jgi:hypothetical protein
VNLLEKFRTRSYVRKMVLTTLQEFFLSNGKKGKLRSSKWGG